MKTLREIELENEIKQLRYENARLRWLVPSSDTWDIIGQSYKPPRAITTSDIYCAVKQVARVDLQPREDLKAREIICRGIPNEPRGHFHYSYFVDNDSLLTKRDLYYVCEQLHENLMSSFAKHLSGEDSY